MYLSQCEKNMKWEIMYLYGTCADRYSDQTAEHPSEEEAQELCNEGWEPVCVLPEWGYNAPALVFRRPKQGV